MRMFVTKRMMVQVVLPLMPGVESVLERGQEQVEEALEDFQHAVDDLQEAIDANVDKVRGNIQGSSEDVKQRYQAAMEALTRASSQTQGEQKHEEVYRRMKEALDAVTKHKNGKDEEK